MSSTPNRRSALGRADLVAALAEAGGEKPDATALYLAEALCLEWVPPQAKPRQRPQLKQAKPDQPPETTDPKVLAAPLLETPFWQVQEVEFFTEATPEPPPAVITPYRGWRNKPEAAPQFQPLASWAELAPRLRKLLCDYREGRAIDLSLTVRQISQGRLLEHFPRERRRRWGPTLMLIEDDSRRLIPYRADKRLVREAIQRLLPAHSLRRALMDECLEKPELLDGDTDWPPPPGTLVLALGDLGCLAAQSRRQRQCWLDIGQELTEGGCHPIALFPAPLSRCAPELAAVWQIVPWERPRPATDGCSLEQRAQRLLRLVAPAARIEPGLLRAVRLLLSPEQADAGTESDVWQHSALSSDSAAAASLIPEQAQTLRLALARETGEEAKTLRRRLVRLIKDWRGSLPAEIWFDELLNFDPDAFDTPELRDDQEDAQSYFAAFCDENPDSTALSMPACDRAWLSRVKARSTGYIWQDRKVGQRLAELALAVDPQAPPPPGIGARDIPHHGKPEHSVCVTQLGQDLALGQDKNQAGSFLTKLSTRNGLVEIAPLAEADGPDAFWATGQPPAWADAWGWDEFGAWVEFSVEGNDGQRVVQRMRWIEPGRFLMGSPQAEAGRWDSEGPQHEVTIREGFWLFDTACTQALWQAVMGDNPSQFKGDGSRPVEQVSWDDAQRFVQALNGRLPGLDLSLPSEAQWEYACRAGTATPFSFGGNITPEQVNYNGDYPYAGGPKGLYRRQTVPAKSLPANPWGLYEMHGNVLEWTQDAWHGNYDGAPNDGGAWEYERNPLPLGEGRVRGIDAGAARVLRGGSWYDLAWFCRSAFRGDFPPDDRDNYLGFRCARVQVSEAGGQGEGGACEPALARPAERKRPGQGRFVALRRAGASRESVPKPVIPAGMPESSHMDVNLRTDAKPSMGANGQSPSMALDSGIPAGMTEYQSQLIRLDAAAPAAVAIPPATAFQVVTDCERLTLRQISKPGWAKAIGRDRFGLWADFAIAPEKGGPVIQRLRWIPPGRFLMGSPPGEPGRWDAEGPQHPVTVSQGYWLFDTPCTQALWEAVIGENSKVSKNPSRFKDPNRPVENVSWDDIQQHFLPALNKLIPGFLLPSEAQWEYACRAGTDTALYTGGIEIYGDMDAPALDPIAWYGGNSGTNYDLEEGYDSSGWPETQIPNTESGTRKVGQKQPNPWGLYDMLGNVREWTQDAWHSNYVDAPKDGSVWSSDKTDTEYVLRGGSWGSRAIRCRSASRVNRKPNLIDFFIGFRCARVTG